MKKVVLILIILVFSFGAQNYSDTAYSASKKTEHQIEYVTKECGRYCVFQASWITSMTAFLSSSEKPAASIASIVPQSGQM